MGSRVAGGSCRRASFWSKLVGKLACREGKATLLRYDGLWKPSEAVRFVFDLSRDRWAGRGSEYGVEGLVGSGCGGGVVSGPVDGPHCSLGSRAAC